MIGRLHSLFAATFVGLAGAAALGFTASACDHSPPFVVERGRLGERSQLVSGDVLRLKRPAQDGYDGIAAGYYVVRSEEQWQALFAKGQEHPLPPNFDFSRSMLVVSAGTPEMEKTHVGRVVDASGAIHVYVQDTLRGTECKAERGTQPPFDITVADRVDKNVMIHVDTDQLPTCGAAPTAAVKCRLAKAEQWSEKVTANPGDAVECEATVDAKGAFVVIDKSWQFSELPGGSLTKMSFSRENQRVAFNVDLFGTYKATFEVSDEADRRGHATGVVEVAPAKSPDLFVQMLWAGFDRNDDPSTFPRIELVVHDIPARGQKEKTCSVAASPKPDFCDIKSENYITNLKILGSATHSFATGVHYIDERVDGGPYVCLRVYLNGARTADTCDRAKRGADETWNLGALDGATGAFIDAKDAFAKEHPGDTGPADAGAPKPTGKGVGKGGAPKSGPPKNVDGGAPPKN
jgi:hypothetical protein